MSDRPAGFTRRHMLTTTTAAAAGAVLLGLTDRARAAGPPLGARFRAGDAAELEQRALALDPPVFLFETQIPSQVQALSGAKLTLSDTVARVGAHSLRWDYQPGAVVEVSAPLGFRPSTYRPGDDQGFMGTVDTFALWLYNERPVRDVLRIEFGRGSGTDAHCEIDLRFAGWRTAWIRYGYDLTGQARSGMNRVRFIAPRNSGAGTLHIDQLILNTEMRPDHPTPDRQVPFVNKESAEADNAHWLALLSYSKLAGRPLPAPAPTSAELESLARVESAYARNIRRSVSVTDASVNALVASVDAFGVPTSTGGAGRPVVGYQEAIYPPAIAVDLKALVNAVGLRPYTDLMYRIATAYDAATASGHRTTLATQYLRMLAHLRDQGWTDGSAQGTIHHLGYQARGLYDSVYLMRDALSAHGLLDEARADLAWLQGIGRLREGWSDGAPYGGVLDIVNTTLQGMLGTALLMPTPAERVAHLKLLRSWLDHALTPSPGIEDGLKVDGSLFHHVGCYPDYGRDGLVGGSPTLAALAGTAFAVSRASHERVKQALLAMRFYANKTTWPLSLTARHPTGDTGLSVTPYQVMTDAGAPDGSAALDRELGAAFLRLLPANPSSAQKDLAKRLAEAGVTAESDPAGNRAMNYAALSLHRRDGWLVAVRGHNRYLWSTEIYATDNLYGRYVTYGQIQVLGGGDPVSNAGSGFLQPGWDWNRWPGTTAIHLPMDALKADLTGTIEEMLLTDSHFCGAGSIDGRHGIFAMDLHEHPKYDESHRARKSVFLFDDRVIALGTGVTNRDRKHPTETTLFQTHLAATGDPQQDSELGTITEFPYDRTRALRAPVWLIDPQRVGYYVPSGQRLALARARQTGPDQGGKADGTADFASAWLDHGTAPSGGTYEYAMLVRATPDRMTEFATRMATPATAPYTVLRRDDTAHVVKDAATGITAYAVFEPVRGLRGGRILAVDTPSLLMAYDQGSDVVLSVTDPDLRLYEGRDEDQYDARGRFVGRVTPFSRPWRRSPSAPHRLTITLSGSWRPAGSDDRVTAERADGKTTLKVRCKDGQGVQIRLTPT